MTLNPILGTILSAREHNMEQKRAGTITKQNPEAHIQMETDKETNNYIPDGDV